MVVSLISVWVGQHHGLLPEQASEQAPLVDNFFNVMVTIAMALFLVVQGAIEEAKVITACVSEIDDKREFGAATVLQILTYPNDEED